MRSPTGHLHLTASVAGSRTVLSEASRTVPFHPGMPSYRDGTGRAEVIVQGVGPGVFPGDDLRIELTVEAGADLLVRGQGATKVYPASDATGGVGGAVSRTMLRVAAGGRLVYLPGELIPFREAVYWQETTVAVAAGGRLALGEILTPGRVAMGERDAFTRLEMRLRAEVAGRLVLVERGVLEPASRPLTAPGRHGGFGCVGSLYLFGDGWRTPEADTGIGPVRWGAGSGEGYVLVRLFGPTAQAVRAVMGEALARASMTPPLTAPRHGVA